MATSPAEPAVEQIQKLEKLPPYRVVLHNDDVNDIDHVIVTVIMLTQLNEADAVEKTFEAHRTGHAVLLVTHRERAELYVDQFASCHLTVTAEPDV